MVSTQSRRGITPEGAKLARVWYGAGISSSQTLAKEYVYDETGLLTKEAVRNPELFDPTVRNCQRRIVRFPCLKRGERQIREVPSGTLAFGARSA